MPKRPVGLVALVLANLFVAVQTLRTSGASTEVMLVFWIEVVILGFYDVLRLMIVGVFGDEPLGARAARWVDLVLLKLGAEGVSHVVERQWLAREATPDGPS